MQQNQIQQARKERGWSQQRLILQMRAAADAAGVKLPDDAALRTSLSRWENGHHRPAALYQGVLAQALELSVADLGFGPQRSSEPVRITHEAVTYLDAMFNLQTKADQQLGSRMLLDVVREQTRQAVAWTHEVRGSVRDPLLSRAGRYSEFCGWLHQDQGDFVAADEWTRRAIEISQELGQHRLVAYALMRRSNIATESGRPADGLRLAEAALRQQVEADPRLVSLCLRQKATAHAQLGEVDSCRRAVEEGAEAVAQGSNVTNPESDYCTVPYIGMEGAHAMTLAGNHRLAITLFTRALADWPLGQHRDRGLCLARLANAHAQVGEVDAACLTGSDAVTSLRSAPSARTESELRRLRGRLVGHRRQPDVTNLRELLAQAV